MSPPAPEVRAFSKARKLTHLLGTSAHRPSGGQRCSWIAFWRKHSGLASPVCCEASCTAPAAHGAHVKLSKSAFRSAALKWRWWLVPTCARHNPAGSCDTFTCKAGTVAVEVEVDPVTRVSTWGADVRHFFL
jgi:hypothetical protein